MKILKKITVRDVCGKITIDDIAKAKSEGVLQLCDIIGIARKARPGSTAMGEFVKFVGSFRAKNLQTGEIFSSGAVILPGAVPDLLYGALGETEGEVQFGFRVGIKYDENAIAKYVYEVESLLAPSEADPVELLASRISSGGQLPAPVQAEEPQEPTEEQPAPSRKRRAA